MKTMTEDHHTIVIGGGPGGASAAIYLARFCHPVIILDTPSEVHGRTSMATSLENFLGNTLPTPGPEFLSRVKVQLRNYNIPVHEEKVTKVSQKDNGFSVESSKGKSYPCRYLVVAIGVGDNMPEIDGLDPYFDTSIFHCLTCDWYEHRHLDAAVIANDDRGITTALALDAMNRPPSLVVIPAKAPTFSEALLEKAKAKNIPVYTSPLKEVHGVFGNLQKVTLEDGTTVKAKVLFTKLGHFRYDQFLDKGGIKVDREEEEGFIKVDWRHFESSVKNLFAVGPCNDGPDQAIIAAGEGALAAMEIHNRILTDLGI